NMALPKDEREAARLYQLAADQGHARPQGGLGLCYMDGRRGRQAMQGRYGVRGGAGAAGSRQAMARPGETAERWAGFERAEAERAEAERRAEARKAERHRTETARERQRLQDEATTREHQRQQDEAVARIQEAAARKQREWHEQGRAAAGEHARQHRNP